MLDLARLEEEARARLDPARFAYVTAASGDSAGLNVAAWQQLRLRPRMLRDVRTVSTTATLLGRLVSTPVMVAPTAMHRLACDEGELATARGAAKAGAIYVVSAQATTRIEDIAAAAPSGARWMQAYMMEDRGLTRAMLGRAAATGCSAVVLTVDAPGIQYTNPGSGRPLNEGFPLPNLLPGVDAPDVLAVASNYAADLTFDDLADIRAWTGLPLVVKGILRGDDAVRCLEAGADAIAVSNHGGRLVPGCVATAIALAEVVQAVAGRAEVYVDGGIRSGVDVLKALALGARAVMVGRPVWLGLAIGGDAGAFAVLDTLRSELERAMALCGLTDVDGVPRDLVCSASGVSLT
jgi:4-hydroxymandelate oxidase